MMKKLSFIKKMNPQKTNSLFNAIYYYFISLCRNTSLDVEFGAMIVLRYKT